MKVNNMSHHLAAHFYDSPLLIHRPKLDTILSVLSQHAAYSGTAAKVPQELLVDAEEDPVNQVGIAVIPVYGTLVRRTLGLQAQSGLVSYASISAKLAEALADPLISAVLLEIDSSGGESGGVFDLVDAIYASRGEKPIWALANDSCFSAAYAIASAADKVFVTRTGGVGSVGVIALHVDQSQADAKEGMTYTAVCAGAKKNDLCPHQPLAEGAKTGLQTEVDRIYQMFTQTVARNRNCSASYVAATDAALFFGPDAVTSGLADGVASFAEVVSQLTQKISKPPTTMSALSSPTRELHMKESVNRPATMADSHQPAAEPAALPAASASISAASYDSAVEIAQLCQLAGMTDKTAELLASGQSVSQVRQSLLAARAAVPMISGHLSQFTPQPTDLVMSIVKRRLGGVSK
jgi:signal peptide peptidase SppA